MIYKLFNVPLLALLLDVFMCRLPRAVWINAIYLYAYSQNNLTAWGVVQNGDKYYSLLLHNLSADNSTIVVRTIEFIA